MFFEMKISLSNWGILSLEGDDAFLGTLNTLDIVQRLRMHLKDRLTSGEVQGMLNLEIGTEEYQAGFREKHGVLEVVFMRLENSSIKKTKDNFVDQLTGLDSSNRLVRDIGEKLSEGESFCLFMSNIDNMRGLNEVYGRDLVDDMLVSLVERMLMGLGSNFHLYRTGGDTFAFLKEGGDHNGFMNKLKTVLETPFRIGSSSVFITFSMGYVNIGNGDSFDTYTLMDHAMVALNHAKSRGKNNWVKYDDGLKKKSLEEIEMESLIRGALQNQEFELYYQPQLSFEKGAEIVGSEALIRWTSEEKGFIPPDRFIPVAEKNGLIIDIGEWVLDEVCRQQREWIDRGFNVRTVGINIGSMHFRKSTFVEDVRVCLERYNLDPSLLGIEITEGTVISDVEDMIEKIKELKDVGVFVSIDDFGTGYSSLSYLHKFPVDTLKIDKSFIFNIPTDHDSIAIVKAVMVLAKHMNLKVIAEGVETESAKVLLRKLDCYEMQGYLFSKPVTVGEFESLMSEEEWDVETS